ncbi:MAG: carboxylesterase family protein [Clostridia bacterium]|nr:carboxylesterase family protein [Clostridia bacterium]
MKSIKSIFAVLFVVGLTMLTACSAGTPEDARAQMLALYGENKQIAGAYDADDAARCSNGVFVGRETDGVLAFKGIPYAVPPVGELRWKEPVPAPDSDAVYQAYYFGKSPIQTEWPSEPGSYYPQSEDCLTLNIWTNRSGTADKKAVMVFFHGGSYGWGAASDPMYDGQNLIRKYPDVVLVTVEFRLGLLGFIDFSSVPGGEDYVASGNLGLLDQVCALRWIQKNIASFGGDPDCVTIFGESSGAGSVSLLPLMREADGLFRRVIAESGSVTLTYSREECRNLTKMLLEKSGCTTMDELTALTEDKLIELNEELNDYNNFPERDGVILPEDLYAAYQNGSAAKCEMLIGTNADEVRYWIWEMGYYLHEAFGMTIYKHLIPVMYENNCMRMSASEKAAAQMFLSMQDGQKIWRLTAFYTELLFRVPAMRQAQLHAANGNAVYTYYWTMPGENETVGACHAVELPYVFNNPQVTIYNGSLYNRTLADQVQDMWVQFARTGDPSTSEITWEPYTAQARSTLILGEEIRTETDVLRKQRELVEPLLGHYFNGCYSQLDFMVPQVYKIGAQLFGTLVLTAAAVVGIVFACRCLRRRRNRCRAANDK